MSCPCQRAEDGGVCLTDAHLTLMTSGINWYSNLAGSTRPMPTRSTMNLSWITEKKTTLSKHRGSKLLRETADNVASRNVRSADAVEDRSALSAV